MNEAPPTRAERALILALAHTARTRAGRIATDHNYPEVSASQRAEIVDSIERYVEPVVIGLRGPGPLVTMDELAVVVDEMALAAVVSVLGDPPTKSAESMN